MQGAATQAMWFIVEERQRRRCPPAAAPRRAAGFQDLFPILSFTKGPKPAAECEVILARALRAEDK